jgi:xanthine dehydrogenase accessory factor
MYEYASTRVPLRHLSQSSGVLAVISETLGTSYRTVGTMMAFLPDGSRVGSLSSGCIEDDIAEHARAALQTGQAQSLRYGIGSPYFDLKLPCGGGLSILLIPNPDQSVLRRVLAMGQDRQVVHLSISLTSGDMRLLQAGETIDGRLLVTLRPELRFWVYGHGVEAIAFAAMTHAAGYDVTLFGQENLQADLSRLGTLKVQSVPSFRTYTCPVPDNRTAITLFFHDHENEARLLSQVLPSDAFFIGAQGSLNARNRLLADLRLLGVAEHDIARLSPDFGLIPSCRDPRSLAVSVMAHVLSEAGRHQALTLARPADNPGVTLAQIG